MLLRTRCACSVKKGKKKKSFHHPSSRNVLHLFTNYIMPLYLVILTCHSSISIDFWDWKKFGGGMKGTNTTLIVLNFKTSDTALLVSPNLESSLQVLNSMSLNTVELAHLSSPIRTAAGRVYAQYSPFAPGMYWSRCRHAALEIAPTETQRVAGGTNNFQEPNGKQNDVILVWLPHPTHTFSFPVSCYIS